MDVTKQKDLSGFYKHLLNDTLSRGAEEQAVKRQESGEEAVKIKTEPPDEQSDVRKSLKRKEKSEKEKTSKKSYRIREYRWVQNSVLLKC